MSIKKVVLPGHSILYKTTYDYTDSYSGSLKDIKTITPETLGQAFFSSSPKWVGSLFQLRNKIVSLFGLKTGGSVQEIDHNSFDIGNHIGLFKVIDKNNNELVLGEDDKHLDFRVSLLLDSKTQNKKLIITTTVAFNNWFGKLYFFPVKPFHKFIVKSMLKKTIKEL